jgi:methionyl-tRNA formyltransferase
MLKRVVFMGTPEFAVPSLQALIRGNYRVVAVYTQPDRKAGRGQRVAFSPVKQLALSHGLEMVQPDNMRVAGTVEKLASFAPDLIVVAAFGHILPQEVLALPRSGCINVHPSLLPRYRGASPVATAILKGDEITGVTIMLLDIGMDTGPILSLKEVPISADDTTGSLTAKLAEVGAQLLIETLPLWVDGRIKPQPQEESRASYSEVINKGDGEMDWQLPAVELWRRVRAFNPWPGCYARWRGKRLKISRAVPLQGDKPGEPGKVIALSPPAPAAVGVETGGGILGLLGVQLEGKREMSADEFVRGQRDFIGSSLF